MSWQFEGEIKARRYVPRIFVTSGSRRESPVKNSSVPGALSESSGLSLRRCLSLLSLSLSLSLFSLFLFRRRARGGDLLHLGILSTCFSTTYLPTYILVMYVCTCIYIALRSRYFCHVLSTTIAELSTPPRSAKEFSPSFFRISENTGCLHSTEFDIQSVTFVVNGNNFSWIKHWFDTYWRSLNCKRINKMKKIRFKKRQDCADG